MNRKNFYQLAIGLVFLGTALTLWAWPSQTETTTDDVRVRSATIVKTDAVRVTEEQRVVRFSGVTRAGRRAVLSFSVPARLVERSVEVGDRVDKGKEIARLDSGEFKNAEDAADASLSELEIRIAQAARDKNRVEVFAELPFAGRDQIKGRIISVARAAAGPGRLFPVIVGLDKAHGISAGMTAELVLKVDAVPSLSIPLRAVINPGASQPSVFVVNNGIARRVPIRIGRLTGDSVIVFGELSEGDRIVIEGHTMLSDGDRVEVMS